MVDPEDSPNGAPAPESNVCEEIGRAVGSLRHRTSGVRPTSVRTEYVGDVVRCTIEEKDDAPSDEEPTAATGSLDSHSYKSQAEVAVSRLTKRRVVGFVTKSKADDETTNTFILERIRTRY